MLQLVVDDLHITANNWHPKKAHTQQLSWFLTCDLFVVERMEITLLIVVLIPDLIFIPTYSRLIDR